MRTKSSVDTAADRWKRVKGVLSDVLDVPEEERKAVLDRRCSEDDALRREVESLLVIPAERLAALERVTVELPIPRRPLQADTTIPDGYTLIRVLGRGGMGEVFLAFDEAHDRYVAVKILKRYSEPLAENERRALAKLEHSNIARLYTSGITESGDLFFVMEYVEGKPIDDYCDDAHLTIIQRVRLFRKVLAALAYAHRYQVVHRDLKPANILVTPEGEPKLLDFGISKLLSPQEEVELTVTAISNRPMTLAFASPEQLAGEATSTTSDVYSAGVLFYYLLAGCLPYRIRRELELFGAIFEQVPERASAACARSEGRLSSDGEILRQDPESVASVRATRPEGLGRRLRGDLDAIVLKALRKEPEERYTSMEEFSEDLRRYLDDEPVTARTGARWYQSRKFLRRHPIAVPLVSVLLVVSSLASAGLAVQLREVGRERERAEAALVESLQSQRRAEQVSEFLVELFDAADPLSTEESRQASVPELLDRARARIGQLPDDAPAKAELVATIGRTYTGLGRYEQASEFVRRFLPGLEAALGSTSREAGTLRGVLGVAERRWGRTDAAVQELEASLAILGEHLAPDAPELADAYEQLSMAKLAASELTEAEELARTGIRILRASRSEEAALALGAALGNLGLIIDKAGRDEEAEQLFRASLARLEKTHGIDHPGYASGLNNLAMSFVAQAKYHEAEDTFRSVLDIQRESLPEGHPVVGNTLNNLAAAMFYAGDVEGAIGSQREALASFAGNVEADHPDHIIFAVNLGFYLKKAGRLDEAETTLRRAYLTAQETLGADHGETANAANKLAELYHLRGELGLATRYTQIALDGRKAGLGAEHWRTAEAQQDLADLMLKAGDSDRALRLAQEALEIQRRSLGDEHWRTASAESLLGKILTARQEYEKAEECLLRALDVLRNERGDSSPTRSATKRLIKLYEEWRKPEKAAEYRELLRDFERSSRVG